MSGPVWNTDHPADTGRLMNNAANLVGLLTAAAPARALPVLSDVLSWHSTLYAGCRVPVPGYVGHFRGDPSIPDLVGYEVGIGHPQLDGLPEKVGVWASDVHREVNALLRAVHAAATRLDSALPTGVRPTTVDELDAVVQLTASVHGEWVRIHPFANGNGRTARAWAAWLALRYELPLFVAVNPRPHDAAYAAAGRASMGRPPDFAGDRTLTARVFSHMLTLSLLS